MAGIVGPDGERFLWVMDPMTRKLRVPMSLIEPTQATAIPGTVPSLCMLFLDGRCRHPACRQVHISMPVLQQLRKEAQQAPNCCGVHGDGRDRSLLTDHYSFLSIVGPPGAAKGNAVSGNTGPQSDASGTSAHPSKGTSSSVAVGGSTRGQQEQLGGAAGSLLTIPVERVAMTVGLQRYIAQGRPLPSPSMPSLKSPSMHPAGLPSVPLSQVALQQYNQQFPPLNGDACQRPSASKDTSSSSTGDAPQENHPVESLGAHGGKQLESSDFDQPTDQPMTNGAVGSNFQHGSVLEIPLKMVCRLHLSKKCRYLEDCNNVHICREYEPKLPPQAPGGSMGPLHNAETLQAIRAGQSSITMGNTTYNVALIASNYISDTEMHQLVTTHKQSYPQLQLRIVDVRSPAGTPPSPQPQQQCGVHGGGKKDEVGAGLDGVSSASSASPVGSPSAINPNAATHSPLQSNTSPFDPPPPPPLLFMKTAMHGMERPLAPPIGAPFPPAATSMNNNSSIVASLLQGSSPPPPADSHAHVPPHTVAVSPSKASLSVSPQRGPQGPPPLYGAAGGHLPPSIAQALPPPAYSGSMSNPVVGHPGHGGPAAPGQPLRR